MFTGIISELGKIKNITKNKGNYIFTIQAPQTYRSLKIGDSVALNGACHTVVRLGSQISGKFIVESIPETLKRTSLRSLKAGSKINLERPVKVGGRLDGHIVTGHIDTTVRLAKITTGKDGKLFTFIVPKTWTKFIVEKGSVALDGISLTVTKVIGNKFIVALIPHTLAITNFGELETGRGVNLEVDILAKHTAKLLNK